MEGSEVEEDATGSERRSEAVARDLRGKREVSRGTVIDLKREDMVIMG
jgi:hypothetical protein